MTLFADDTYFGPAHTQTLAAGSHLFRQGGPAAVIYCVEAGCLRLERFTPAGTTVVLHTARPGELLVEGTGIIIEPINVFQQRDSTSGTIGRDWSLPLLARRALSSAPAIRLQSHGKPTPRERRGTDADDLSGHSGRATSRRPFARCHGSFSCADRWPNDST